MAERLTVLSAFTGLGGFDLGLEAAGFKTVGCIEADANARLSIKANRNDEWPLLEEEDIADIAADYEPRDLGLRRRELSILAGGPPCQPFSKAAQWAGSARNGLADPRAGCLLDFLTLVDIFLPEVVLIENVPGFISGDVSALPTIQRRLKRINANNGTHYELQFQVVNAADYGVPQRRVRAIAIACRNGTQFEWPETTHADAPTTAWDAIGHLRVNGDAPAPVGKWATLLPSIPEGENYLWHTNRGGGRPLFGYRTRYWSFLLKLARDQPAWTVSAQPGPSTGPFHWDNRPLAIQERLALQTFPTTWIVEGDLRAQVRQVGNATPPLLAEIFGRAIRSQLFEQPVKKPLRYDVKPKTKAPPAPTRRGAVPASFRSLEKEHPDHPGTGMGPKPRTSKP